MHFMQIESVLQTNNQSEPAKYRFSVALMHMCFSVSNVALINTIFVTSI